jgi:hypothetical protein
MTTNAKMSKEVLSSLEEYQRERVKFVQTVAELARKPQNLELLQTAGNLLNNKRRYAITTTVIIR